MAGSWGVASPQRALACHFPARRGALGSHGEQSMTFTLHYPALTAKCLPRAHEAVLEEADACRTRRLASRPGHQPLPPPHSDHTAEIFLSEAVPATAVQRGRRGSPTPTASPQGAPSGFREEGTCRAEQLSRRPRRGQEVAPPTRREEGVAWRIFTLTCCAKDRQNSPEFMPKMNVCETSKRPLHFQCPGGQAVSLGEKPQ